MERMGDEVSQRTNEQTFTSLPFADGTLGNPRNTFSINSSSKISTIGKSSLGSDRHSLCV
jgi:hypothetical protein